MKLENVVLYTILTGYLVWCIIIVMLSGTIIIKTIEYTTILRSERCSICEPCPECEDDSIIDIDISPDDYWICNTSDNSTITNLSEPVDGAWISGNINYTPVTSEITFGYAGNLSDVFIVEGFKTSYVEIYANDSIEIHAFGDVNAIAIIELSVIGDDYPSTRMLYYYNGSHWRT